MQKNTLLKLNDLLEQFRRACENEWKNAASGCAESGFPLPGGTFYHQIGTIGLSLLDKLIEDIFSVEKDALQRVAAPLPDNYFSELENEFVQVAQARLQDIQSQIFSYNAHFPMGAQRRTIYEQKFKAHNEEYRTKIKNKVELLGEELRLGIASSGATTIHVSGDVGQLNAGIIYGNVHGNIEKMSSQWSEEIAKIFDQLLTAIKKESQIGEDIRREQMLQLGVLISQLENPPAQRNRGLISTALNYLSSAANLTTLWAQFGPMILETLK